MMPNVSRKPVLDRILGALLLAMAALLALPALAQTTVSGAIGANSRWNLAGAPYVVSGNVSIENNAVLTIDPGVTVFMGAGTSLTVVAGSIRAAGTSVARIRVLSDKTRQGGAAAPGDWKNWVFTAGTRDTQLDNVDFEYGSGLQVRGSAPVFNNLAVRNHLGAAISVDLTASPSGVGNEATGNTLNGIEVPGGEIRSTVNWGLRGIPYVVAAGTVSVGAAPTVSGVSPTSLQQGESTTVTVSGTRLAGLAGARFDKPGLTAEVLAGGTDTQASLTVRAEAGAPVGNAALTVVADAGEATLANALNLIQSQPVLAGVAPATLYAGQGPVAVTLSGRNFNAQSTLLVDGTAVTTQFVSPTQMGATLTAPAVAGNLRLRLRTPDPVNAGQNLESNEVILPVASGQLVLSPSSVNVVKGRTETITLTLPFAAPAGGVVVNLASNAAYTATVPATVTIPEGQSSASFVLSAVELGGATITATRTGSSPAYVTVSVIRPPTLTIVPASITVGVGRPYDATIQSNVAAGAGGIEVTLQNSNPAVVSAPASVVIPAGNTSVRATLNGLAVGNATLTASATDFVSGSASVNVHVLKLTLPTSARLTQGLVRNVAVTLSDAAPAGGLEVSVASSNAAAVTAPATVTVAAGQTSANIALTGVADGTSTMTVTAAGYQTATIPVTVATLTASIGSPVVSAVSIPAGITQSQVVSLSGPAPTGGIAIALTMADTGIATTSGATVTVNEGQTAIGFNLSGVAKGSTTLATSGTGISGVSVPITVTGKPALSFNIASATAGKGMRTYVSELSVQRKTDGVDYAPAQALNVTLAASDAAKLGVPATIIIPAGQSSATFMVSGADLTGTPVTVDATATNYTAPATKLSVSVVAPQVGFVGLDAARNTTSLRDGFQIAVVVPGAGYPNSQTAVADTAFDLSLVDASPADIVPGFFTAASGGTATTQVTLRQGQTMSDTVYIGTPTAGGSYKIRASAAGIASSTSMPVTVGMQELRFSSTAVTIGKGLRSHAQEVQITRVLDGTPQTGSALTVDLSTGDAAKVGLPASVTIPAGQSVVSVPVTGLDLTAGTPVTVDASAAGYSAPASKLAVSVVAPTLNLTGLEGARTTSDGRDDFNIRLATPGSPFSGNQPAAADIPVNVGVVDVTPAGVVDGIYASATGGTPVSQVLIRKDQVVSDTVYVAAPSGYGSYKVQASASSMTSVTTAAIAVSAQVLEFSKTWVTVGKGLKTPVLELGVTRLSNGTPLSGTDALVVNLSASDASKLAVPASVTIPAGQSTASFAIAGLNATSGSPVAVDASASGFTAPTQKLTVDVVLPQLRIEGLEPNRSTSGARDDFSVSIGVQGEGWIDNQAAASDMAINLAIIDAAPAGIIGGFFDAASGGSAISQVLLRQGQTASDTVFVGVPAAAGSYRVQAAIAGIATGTSDPVSVAAQNLSLAFATTSVSVDPGASVVTSISRLMNGQPFEDVQPLTVALSSSDAGRASVPASVTIPAGSSSVNVEVSGVAVTQGSPVLIDASAPGYAVPDNKLAVNVGRRLELNFSQQGIVGLEVGGRMTVEVWRLADQSCDWSGESLTVVLSSSDSGKVGVPASVVIPAGQCYVSFAINGLANTVDTPVTLDASAPGYVSPMEKTQAVVGVPFIVYWQNSIGVTKGGTSENWFYRYVRLGDNNNAWYACQGCLEAQVSLTSSDPARVRALSPVIVPAGQYWGQFSVEGVENTGGVPVIVDASVPGYSASPWRLNVHVGMPALRFWNEEPVVEKGKQVRVGVGTVIDGASYISGVDTTIALTSSDPTKAVVPASIVVGAGGNYAEVEITGLENTNGVPVMLDASAAGFRSPDRKAAVRVGAPHLRFDESFIVIGVGERRSITLRRMIEGREYGGPELVVNLLSGNPAAVAVPATVTFQEGYGAMEVEVTGQQDTNGMIVSIDASTPAYGGSVANLQVSVGQMSLGLSFSVNNNSLGVGRGMTASVGLCVYDIGGAWFAAGADIPIALSSSETGKIAFPATVTIAAGNSCTYFEVTGIENTGTDPMSFTATAAGISPTSMSVHVGTPELRFLQPTLDVGKGLQAKTMIYRFVKDFFFPGTDMLTLDLASSDPARASVPPNIVMTSFNAYGLPVDGKVLTGGAPVSVSVTPPAGYTVAGPMAVRVVPPELDFSGVPANLGMGSGLAFDVLVTAPGPNYIGDQITLEPVTVSLTSNPDGIVSVPSSVSIAGGASRSSGAVVNGVAAGSATISAAAAGFAGKTSAAIVVAP